MSHTMSDVLDRLLKEQNAEIARDCLVGLMGARQANRLIAQLYAEGLEITPIPAKPGYAEKT